MRSPKRCCGSSSERRLDGPGAAAANCSAMRASSPAHRAAACLAGLALAAAGCASSPPPPQGKLVVVLGASTAAGAGSAAGHSWVALLQANAATACPAVTIKNLAYPGYTTPRALPAAAARPAGRPASDSARNLDAALAFKPVLVLVQFPSNDAAAGYPLDETIANLTTLREGVRAAGALDELIGPFPRAFPDAPSVALMTGLRDRLPAVGAPRYLALWSDFAKADNQLLDAYSFGDGIHVNEAGHALIAMRVLASAGWAAVCAP